MLYLILGGTIGLFTGMSLLSMIEVVGARRGITLGVILVLVSVLSSTAANLCSGRLSVVLRNPVYIITSVFRKVGLGDLRRVECEEDKRKRKRGELHGAASVG